MASQGALRHVIRRREHRERAQPAARASRFGLLEKKKDYKLRANDYHRKEDAIRTLKEKAAFKNQDEFYMNMNKSQTKVRYRAQQTQGSLCDAMQPNPRSRLPAVASSLRECIVLHSLHADRLATLSRLFLLPFFLATRMACTCWSEARRSRPRLLR